MKQTNLKYWIFNVVNFVYLVFGLCLVVSGTVYLTDFEKILISRLVPVNWPEPFLYYVWLGILLLGLVVTLVSTIGCWAVHSDNYWLMSMYLFGVTILLLGESVLGILMTMCPQYLGLTFSKDSLTESWQSNYGVPGKEPYTAAIDLIHYKLECCGVNGGTDFDRSWWKLRNLAGPNLTVPLSCCFPDKQLMTSFLDPVPLNVTLCQDTAFDSYSLSRYFEGCLHPLESWIGNMKSNALMAVLCKLAVQLLALLTVIISCDKPKIKPVPYFTATPHSSYSTNSAKTYS